MPGAQYLSPIPGSKFVAQQSNIIVRIGPQLNRSVASDASLFAISGTKSGTINGKVVLSDDDRTLLFLPAKQFLPGETVSVLMKNGIHSLSGEMLAPVSFEFTVSQQTSLEKKLLDRKALDLYMLPPQPAVIRQMNTGSAILNKTGADLYPPSLPVPVVKVDEQPEPGSVFLSPWKIVLGNNGLKYVPSESQYLMILDGGNQPIFYRQRPAPTFDFKVLPNGMLIYFDQYSLQYFELDNTYATIDSFTCGNGYVTDPHDIRLLPNGHFILVGLDPESIDMSTIVDGGDPLATVIGFVVQELDTNKNVVFEWRSFDHFQITDATHEDLTAATIDYAHPNALEIDADTTILLSDRHMDEITKIDRATGNIVWRWGGKNNQFMFTNDTLGFSHQHSINRTAEGHFTVFDNGNFHTPQFSRAVEYTVDEQMKTATLVWQFRHTPDVFTFAMGSVERLPSGNTFIGWGASTLAATEVRPDGSTAYEIQFPDSIISYRAFKFPVSSVASRPVDPPVPHDYSLEQNYPNPFNPSTVIKFTLPEQSFVTLKVYDVIGNEVRTLANSAMPAGQYAYTFQAGALASGMYLYRMTAVSENGNRVFTDVKKFLLIK
jgi:hypothetical protein